VTLTAAKEGSSATDRQTPPPLIPILHQIEFDDGIAKRVAVRNEDPTIAVQAP
jgi:hypothetical protein